MKTRADVSLPADAIAPSQQQWRAGAHTFAWGQGRCPHLMAILNTTPDSFSDGGVLADAEAAIVHGSTALLEGATILDVGGESTRPGAVRVDAAEQIRRTRACIAGLLQRTPAAAVSIDTTLAAVAEAALDAGASIVNDVSAGCEDPRLLEVAASRGAGLVLMHRRAAPGDDRYSDQHPDAPAGSDVVREVRDWLALRVQAAQRAGVQLDRIVIDPGLGFGKSVAENFELVARLREFASLGLPVLVGASRKSFVGAVTGERIPAQRLAGSLGVALAAAANGAALLRVHDVAAHAQALATWHRAC